MLTLISKIKKRKRTFAVQFYVMRHFDFLVAGSGLAGLYSAYRASIYGSVALITKGKLRQSNSYFAQGGIAAVTDENDSPEFHFEDTIVAGRGLCDNSVVDILVNEGPLRIKELVEAGMKFDTDHGAFMLGLEGGHNKRRILHSGGDATGKKMTEFMIEKVLSKENISLFENNSVTEIITLNNKCYGLKVWDIEKNIEEIFTGNNTILSLGGASAIYDRTSNPETSVGDGIALAYEAGCKIADMEFIQFHPTTLYTESGESYLISEAVRGEGAYLLNSAGERFMKKIHEKAELAPRDIVARSIYKEIKNQIEPYVILSLEHINADTITSRFPNIYRKCLENGFDLTKRIPVAPAAHYMVGGVRTDKSGRTNIENLYVTGEMASNGMMGANRLASNSLMECLVFSYRAVESAKQVNESPTNLNIPTYTFADEKNKSWLYEVKESVERIMSECAGIIRNETNLHEGIQRINQLKNSIPGDYNEFYTKAGTNLLTVATLILQSALYRKESRGGHFREDFPSEDKRWLFHIIQQKNRDITVIPVDNKKS